MPGARVATRAGPRPGVVALGVLLLLAAFLAVRFPYERLLPALQTATSQASGAATEIEALGVGLGWGGPEVVARGVDLVWPGSASLRLDRVAVRPAWSLAWLRGRPRWHVATSGPPGSFAGEVAGDRVAGEFTALDLTALPWAELGASAPVQGRLSGRVDLSRSAENWSGWADLRGAEGSVDFAGLPVAIPYQDLAAHVELAPGQLDLTQARLEGPLVTAHFAGSATPSADSFETWPLELAVEIERIDPALGGYLRPLGIRLDSQGHASLRVTGTLAAPVLASGGR